MRVTEKNKEEIKSNRIKRMLAPIFPMIGAGLCLIAAWAKSGQTSWSIVAGYFSIAVILGILSSGILICSKLDERFERLESLLKNQDKQQNKDRNNVSKEDGISIRASAE